MSNETLHFLSVYEQELDTNCTIAADYSLYDSQATISQRLRQLSTSNSLYSQELHNYDWTQFDTPSQEVEKPLASSNSLDSQRDSSCCEELKENLDERGKNQSSDYARLPGVFSQPAALPRYFHSRPGQFVFVNDGGPHPILFTDQIRIVNACGQTALVPSTNCWNSVSSPTGKSTQPQIHRNSSARMQKTPGQIKVLETHYSMCSYPSSTTRKQIALETGLTDNQVRLWFQYKRNKKNKESQEA